MGPRQKNWCQTVVLKAIRVAVPAFQHSCTCTAHKALRVLGSRVDEYCTAKNGTRTTTTLIPDQLYPICYRMKTQVIDKLLLEAATEEEAAAAANAAFPGTHRPDPPSTAAAANAAIPGTHRPDPPSTAANTNADPPGVGVGSVILLPGATNMVLKQEAAAEIAASTEMANDRIMIHDHFTNINNNNSSTATARASTATDTVAAPPGGGVTSVEIASAADPGAPPGGGVTAAAADPSAASSSPSASSSRNTNTSSARNTNNNSTTTDTVVTRPNPS